MIARKRRKNKSMKKKQVSASYWTQHLIKRPTPNGSVITRESRCNELLIPN